MQKKIVIEIILPGPIDRVPKHIPGLAEALKHSLGNRQAPCSCGMDGQFFVFEERIPDAERFFPRHPDSNRDKNKQYRKLRRKLLKKQQYRAA